MWTRWSGFALPLVLGAVAFLVVDYVIVRESTDRSDLAPQLEQPVGTIVADNAPLQVAVHDLVEGASSPAAVRICRTLANRPVSVHVGTPKPLSVVLKDLADQAGGELVMGIEHKGDRALPTIACPKGRPGDYFTIGVR